MTTNITRIGEVFQRKDTGHVWLVESLWWGEGRLVQIDIISVGGQRVVRDEITPNELQNWIDKGLVFQLPVMPGRRLPFKEKSE